MMTEQHDFIDIITKSIKNLSFHYHFSILLAKQYQFG